MADPRNVATKVEASALPTVSSSPGGRGFAEGDSEWAA